MNKKDFAKLAVGDRVIVSGTQDSKTFDAECGRIVEVDTDEPRDVLVRFDTWEQGHGKGDNEWHFYDSDARAFTITVAKPVTAAPKKRPHGSQEYKGNGKHSWEDVTYDTKRLRVPGGWLYSLHDEISAPALTFVPVPEAVGYAV